MDLYKGKILLGRIENINIGKIISQVIDDNKISNYESFIKISDNEKLTPFSSYPFVKKTLANSTELLIKYSPYELIKKNNEIDYFQSEVKILTELSNFNLYNYICSNLSIDNTKRIKSIWYSDRYLLRIAENICLLWFLEDAQYIENSEVNIAIDKQSRFDDWTFENREEQKKFLNSQIKLSKLNNIKINLFESTSKSDKNDPGKEHSRCMLIIFEDESKIKLSFDSGMTIFSPYIDNSWNKYNYSYRQMVFDCIKRKNKFPKLSQTIIFKFPYNSSNNLKDRIEKAISEQKLKLI